MRVLVLSDLHLELGTSYTLPPSAEFDVAILAGDIQAPGRKAITWAKRQSVFGGKPVVFVPGNHEYYGAPSFFQELKAMREEAKGSNVHVLDRAGVVIDGVRFLGCTLWTDFQLPIRVDDGIETNIELAIASANERMNDYRLIQVEEATGREFRYQTFKRLLRAQETMSMHWLARDWLRRELRKPFEGPTVVVTHHGPSMDSVAQKYVGDELSPSFVSHLPDEFFESAALWVHGHTHTPADYPRGRLNRCRVITNPRGYRTKDGSFENGRFDPAMVVAVEATD